LILKTNHIGEGDVHFSKNFYDLPVSYMAKDRRDIAGNEVKDILRCSLVSA